jgi:hypothetical protein
MQPNNITIRTACLQYAKLQKHELSRVATRQTAATQVTGLEAPSAVCDRRQRARSNERARTGNGRQRSRVL